ncbi:MAG TPA: tetraacyldisaccharide 4'-kinase [Rhabdaerophilum sp.]|nr:tetraacyldisaccharide 4'-kinase [Rhabdaerophilum sp.]
MRAPAFWSRSLPFWLAPLLRPLGAIYGALTLRRMARPGWRASVPAISVGNFTAGGAGKTPTALALAQDLIARGERPAFVSRGYGGSMSGPHRVNPTQDSAWITGDEPLLLARIAPTYVARDRAAGGRRAIADGATCLILDDALQNPALTKDLSVAVVDGAAGFGNGEVIPAGPLRAPFDAQLPFVDLVLVIGEDRSDITARADGRKPVLSARIVPEGEHLAGRDVIAFCGIALPEKFQRSLEACGARVIERIDFADHHAFTDVEAESLLARVARSGAQLVTTEKDHVRLAGSPMLEKLATESLALPIRLVADEALFEAVHRALGASRSRRSAASGPE